MALIDTKQREVIKLKKEISDLQKKDAAEEKKEITKAKDIERTSRSLNTTKSDSTARSYRQKIIRLSDEINKISTKRAGFSKKIADKTNSLHRAEQSLVKVQEKERKKIIDAEKRREKEQLEHQRKISEELHNQKNLIDSIGNKKSSENETEKYDCFISHASEDKESFVRALADKLVELGCNVWYDDLSLKVGDSLRQKIDQGLSLSRYGIVVLSESFFSKNWPQYELNGLVAKEMHGGKVILPIWHKVSKEEVIKFSPTLADKVALNSSLSSIAEIATQLAEVLSEN